MDEAEFDKFAVEYREIHSQNIKASGEAVEFFAEYKVRDTVKIVADRSFPTDLRILDFGAGTGTSLPYFKKYFPRCRLTCLDVSAKSLEVGNNRFPGQAEFVAFDGSTLPFPKAHFDLSFAACVFHHIDHVEHAALLAELRRVLRPGGMLVIFEHNPFNPLTVHAVNTCPFDENAVLIRANDLKRRLMAAGFASVVRRYRIFFPRPLRIFRPFEAYLTWLPLGAQYYVAAEKSLAA
jgi:ubiquinone/menaquinone biosynthesis C-methylase UbiE